MLPMKTLMKRVRRTVHDVDALTYDDEEIVDVLNAGINFVRRTIADTRPEFLAGDAVEGTLEAGERSMVLPYRPLVFLWVRAGDDVAKAEEKTNSQKIWHNYNQIYHNYGTLIYNRYMDTTYKTYKLPEVNMSQIHGNLDREGKPEVYYLSGAQTVNFYPVPSKTTKYDILAIADIEEIGIEDVSPLPTEYDDILVEYANLRLSIENEYDVSADSQVMSNIHSQILRLLHVPPAGVIVQGYWNRNLNRFGRPVNKGAW